MAPGSTGTNTPVASEVSAPAALEVPPEPGQPDEPDALDEPSPEFPVVSSSSPVPTSSAPAASIDPPMTRILRLKNAPNGEYPSVAAHLPGSLKHLNEIPVVVFFHGWHGCLKVLLGPEHAPCRPGKKTRYSMDLENQFDAAGVDALLVVPQLAYDEASSAPGKLIRPGNFKAMLKELVNHPALASYLPDGRKIGRTVLIAHSGGYLPLGQALGHGGVDVHEVWMMDAHYLNVPSLSPWFRAHRADFSSGGQRRMAFLYTETEKTGPRSLHLLGTLTAKMEPSEVEQTLWKGEVDEVAPEEALRHPLVAQKTEIRHEKIPRFFLVPMLQTAQLPGRDHQGH